MLVLTRKTGESIVVGDDIEIKIVECSKGKVQIGIEAPQDIAILRKEILKQVEESNIKALESSSKLELSDLVANIGHYSKEGSE